MKNNHKDNPDHALITTDVQIDRGMPRDKVIQRVREHAQSYRAAAKHLRQAIDALNTKDYQRAIGEFQQALQHNRESAEGHFYLGLTYFMVGEIRRGIGFIQTSDRLRTRRSNDTPQFRNCLSIARTI